MNTKPLTGILTVATAHQGELVTEEQDHLLAPEVPTQVADELDQRLLVVVAVLGLEVQPGPGAVPAVGEGRRPSRSASS